MRGPSKGNKGSGKWSRVSEVRMREVRGTSKDAMTPVMGGGRAEVERSLTVARPRLPLLRGVVDDDQLTWEVDGVGGEIVDGTVQAVPSRDGGSREKERKWLRVNSVWGRRRSQRSEGKKMCVEARVAMMR